MNLSSSAERESAQGCRDSGSWGRNRTYIKDAWSLPPGKRPPEPDLSLNRSEVLAPDEVF
jgi:hypothetical protein